MSQMLSGKIALVTGAGSGLGRAISIGFASEGAHIILVGRRATMLQETQEIIHSKNGQAAVYVSDISQREAVEMLKEHVLQQIGVPSILVNAAGVYGEINRISESDPETWIQTLMTNAAGPYLLCRAFVGAMVNKGWGRIINLTSAASLSKPNPQNSAYAVSKVALNYFTRQLAAEVDGTGVTANVLHPGEVKTEMFDAIRKATAPGGDMENWVKWVEDTGGDHPDKSVRRILDLAKPENSHVNGRFLWIEHGLKNSIPSWDTD